MLFPSTKMWSFFFNLCFWPYMVISLLGFVLSATPFLILEYKISLPAWQRHLTNLCNSQESRTASAAGPWTPHILGSLPLMPFGGLSSVPAHSPEDPRRWVMHAWDSPTGILGQWQRKNIINLCTEKMKGSLGLSTR